MGARMLRRFLEQPLIDRAQILARQDAIEELCGHYIDREEMSEYLNTVYDFERLLGKICYKTANPRDLIAFKQSLRMLPDIRQELGLFEAPLMKEIYAGIDEMQELYQRIDQAIGRIRRYRAAMAASSGRATTRRRTAICSRS